MTRRPRILFLSQVLPYPLNAGPKVRAYHVLAWLAEHADVHLLSFVRGDDSPEAIEHLRSVCAEVTTVAMPRSPLRDLRHMLAALAKRSSFIIERDRVSEMRDAVNRALEAPGYDAVHADQLWMARYALQGAPSLFRVLDSHNAVYVLMNRLAANERSAFRSRLLRREARLLSHYEARMIRDFDQTLFVTAEDRDAIIRAEPSLASLVDARTTVVPICVDTEAREIIRVTASPTRITILGTMYWPPNAEGALWFAREVFPLVKERAPEAKLTIVGKNPPASLYSLAEADSQIETTGFVDDPRDILQQTAAFVVPLLSGGGMRVKILDAWSWGLPVVSTTIGAEGIDAADGRDILIADSPRDFATAVVRLIEDGDLRSRLGIAGRRTVEHRYDVKVVYRALEGVYAPVLGSRT